MILSIDRSFHKNTVVKKLTRSKEKVRLSPYHILPYFSVFVACQQAGRLQLLDFFEHGHVQIEYDRIQFVANGSVFRHRLVPPRAMNIHLEVNLWGTVPLCYPVGQLLSGLSPLLVLCVRLHSLSFNILWDVTKIKKRESH